MMKKFGSLLFFVGLLSMSLFAQDAEKAVPAAKKMAEKIPAVVETVKEVVATEVAAAPAEKKVAKKANLWRTLSKITFRKQYDELMGFKIDVPVFSKPVQALEGKEVTIKGYIIPVEGYKGHKEFILSAFPYNMCFFCGGAGPETVMEVLAKDEIEYTAEAVTIKGKLELNSDDINRLMYSMSDAVLVKDEE